MEFIDRFIFVITQVHPLHPMIVHFPIALTGAAFFLVVVAYWKKNPSFESAAFVNIALAVVGTLAAGVTGFLDNIKNYEGEAPNAPTKIILAITLFLLTTGLTIYRWRTPDAFIKVNMYFYISLYGLSFLIAFVLGFLGGVILYGF